MNTGVDVTIQPASKWIAVWLSLAALLSGAGSVPAASAQTIPNAVISTAQVLAPVNGNSGHVAVNAFGTVFWISTTDATAYMLPLGATTPIAVVTGVSSATNVYVDASNNLYVPGLYSSAPAMLLEVPYIAGAYSTGITDTGTNFPVCSSAPSGPCRALNNGAGTTGYYLQVGDIGIDAAGDVFVMDARDNVSSGNGNRLLKFAAPVSSTTLPTVVLDNLPQNNNAQIAVDAAGDVYYADGTFVYSVPAGAKTATKIGTGLVSPTGVSVDQYGDLFITDSSSTQRIVEMPAKNGVAVPASQFNVTYNYSANGVAVDPQGRIFYTSYANSSTNISLLTPFGNFGSLALAKPSGPTTFTAVFNNAQTATSIGLTGVSNGAFTVTPGTCAVGTAYASGSNCTITATFTPNAVGLQTAAIVISGASGNIATSYLYGIGVGAAQTADPGLLTAVGAGWQTPAGLAVDPAGNIYIADTKANTVSRYTAGGSVPTLIGTGLSAPTSVATDGAGNVFIADSGNGRILEVPVTGTAPVNAAQSILYTGTKGVTGISVDSAGNLFLADSGNKQVIRLASVSGTPSANQKSVIGSGFMAPIAVVTDNMGDVFVADTKAVTEISPANTSLAISSSLVSPSGLAIDASGSLYIADPGSLSLIKVPYEKGAYNANDQFSVGQGIVTPYAVALDAQGNLYVTDGADSSVSQLLRTQGQLALGAVNLNSTSSTLTGEISSAGNQPLTFGSPLYTQTGTPAPFTIIASNTNGCGAGSTLLQGFACTLSVSFTPVVKGNFTDTLGFSSNAMNIAMPQLSLTGTGTFLAPDSLVLAVTSPTGAIPLGAPVTIKATISSTGSGTPTGTVAFFVGGNPKGTVQVTNGQASITLPPPNGGPSTVAATYSGDLNFASAAASPLVFTVVRSTTYTSFAIPTVTNVPMSTTPGSTVSLSAFVFPNGLPSATGTVSFFNGTALLGSTPVQPTGSAVLSTTLLPTGSLNITAVYSGDVNYTGSTSLAVALIISPASFTITPSAPSLTVTAGVNGSLSLTATQLSGYSGTIGLNVCGPNPSPATCSNGLPADTIFSFNPNTFILPSSTLGASAGPPSLQNVTLMVLTNQVPAIAPPGVVELHLPGSQTKLPIALAFLLLAPLGLAGRRILRKSGRHGMPLSKALMLLLTLLAGLGATTLSGCSNSFFGTTAAGTYNLTIVVTGSPSATTQPLSTLNIPFKLTVQ